MSAPASRPVHPCLVSLNDSTRGAEFSTWARITPPDAPLPNLCIASASSLTIYSVDPSTGKLLVEYEFGNLAGSLVHLSTLTAGHGKDALLAGFAGHARLTVLTVYEGKLRAESLWDLTPALTAHSYGSTPQEDVLIASTHTNESSHVACILGGGVAVAVMQVHSNLCAQEPYILPLQELKLPYQDDSATNLNAAAMSTGWGEISSAVFLTSFLEPVVVLLHTTPLRTWSARTTTSNPTAYYATALSVSVTHQRTAVLWSQPVPADALYLTALHSRAVAVVAANSITFVSATGQVEQPVLAVNGWAYATCPLALDIQANPVLKLAISLDGSALTPLSDTTALLSLRCGQLYVLQATTVDSNWTLLPLGQTLGGIGQVMLLSSLPCNLLSSNFKMLKTQNYSSMGLVFAGSLLGDSMLLGYALETVQMPVQDILQIKQEDDPTASGMKKEEDEESPETTTTSKTAMDQDYDRILQQEEDALYSDNIHIVPPSDTEEDSDGGAGGPSKRAKLAQMTIVRALTPLDVLIHPGPLGPSAEGPIARPRVEPDEKDSLFGAFARIFPAGYGSSGSLCCVTVPGRDDRHIVAEEDCVNVRSVAAVAAGWIFMDSGEGIRVLQQEPDGTLEEVAVDPENTDGMDVELPDGAVFGSVAQVLKQTSLVAAGDFHFESKPFVLVVRDDVERLFCVAVDATRQKLLGQSLIEDATGVIVSLTPVQAYKDEETVVFGSVGSSGEATVFFCKSNGSVSQLAVPSAEETVPMDTEEDEDEDDKKLREYYSSSKVVAIDIFEAPRYIFESKVAEVSDQEPVAVEQEPAEEKAEAVQEEGPKVPPVEEAQVEARDWSKLTVAKLKVELESRGIKPKGKKADLVALLETSDKERAGASNHASGSEQEPAPAIATTPVPIDTPARATSSGEAMPTAAPAQIVDACDEEDEALYTETTASQNVNPRLQTDPTIQSRGSSDMVHYVAVCRQSGRLEVFLIDVNTLELVWVTSGCGYGSEFLGNPPTFKNRYPRTITTCVKEMRFFTCGPTSERKKTASGAPAVHPHSSLCLLMETKSGDSILYKASRVDDHTLFHKVHLRSIGRKSRGQDRHYKKLLRKKIVSEKHEDEFTFQTNQLHRFSGISGQDGIFYSGYRPQWIVNERGRPTFLFHRTRHASPVGGTDRPIRAFCPNLEPLSDGDGKGFLTLHERVGKVGSQRLTVFSGLSNVFNSTGFLPGGGVCVEKIPLDVTVRCIEFITDLDVSTGSHPMYAVLVSKEVEFDQSEWNSDGLTDEERRIQEEEKEKARIQKQVEADLAGFDLNSEWVEEIERENHFKIRDDLGGAPPVRRSLYSLCIVDAASNWAVIDSYELGEYEHGLTLQAMSLTEFRAEPGSTVAVEVDDIEDVKLPFIAVGTGIVDHNGEDVSSKGRVLLFSLKASQGQIAELALSYEKAIFHGPVTTLRCLSVEGRNRLVIGAGSDINIEQWGNDKLTQVGFFRATMEVLDITLFKNFFLLSDAYDSLYFLVWRESDKSLTLLAKDYDPIAVYAAGLMSRGAAMTFVCQDDRQNLQFFQYAPGEAAARGGNRLVCRSDCHLGAQTTAFQSHFCRSPMLVHSATPSSTLTALKQQDTYFGRSDDDQRLGVFFGTTDGGIGSIVPLSEPVYWRLMALQSVMANALEANCSLNQRAWRLYRRTPRRGGCRSNDRKKGVIDGDLVLQYADLPLADQEDLAASIGSTVELILDNLLDVQCGSLML